MQRQFNVFAINSSRLKTNKIVMSIENAKENNELVAIADSELLRVIRKVNGSLFLEKELETLWKERDFLRRSRIKKNAYRIKSLSEKIDNMLFVPEIIIMKFARTSHYKNLLKKGLFVNGKEYVRMLAGAGHVRRNSVLFIEKDLLVPVRSILENGINKSINFNYGKFNAYFGLFSSASTVVETPRFCVVPDYEFERIRLVDYVDNAGDGDFVTRKEILVKTNAFDGQGLISTNFANAWSKQLRLDYEAISFIVRAPFIKGQLVSFPFHSFADEYHVDTIRDVYGKTYNIKDVDVILTESQFKMKSAYSSIEEYSDNCRKNGLSWGVSRVNPKKDKDVFWSSYQYLQVLDLSDENVESLCAPTINYFKDVSMLDADKSIIYLSGDIEKGTVTKGWYEKQTVAAKALMLNQDCVHDPYISQLIFKMLNKKIRESYAGKIMLHGNYQFAISDPVALCQHAFGLDVTGLIEEGFHYSEYWNSNNVSKVVSGRSPLTWKTELNTLSLVSGKLYEKWFGHIYSGVVINIFGVDTMLWADSDFDGDLIFTTDNEQMMIGCDHSGVPVTYEKIASPKNKLEYDILPEYDMESFGSKIGLITNWSTTYYSMLSQFEKGSPEYNKINERLIIARKLQGQQIDKTKGIKVVKPPDWSKFKKLPQDEFKKELTNLENGIRITARPMWMSYLYPYKNKEFRLFKKIYDNYSFFKFGIGIDSLMRSEPTGKKEKYLVSRYIKNSPLLIFSSGTMDKIYQHMVSRIQEVKDEKRNMFFDYTVYMTSKRPRISEQDVIKLIKRYNMAKKDFSKLGFENAEAVFEVILSDAYMLGIEDVTNIAVKLCYEKKSNLEFLWNVLGNMVIQNMENNGCSPSVPVLDKEGSFEFLNKKYSMISL